MSGTFRIVNQDVVISAATGRPSIISDGPKLSQDLKELFDLGLDELIGSLADPFALRAELTQQVRGLVRSLQLVQQQYLAEARPAEERISRIANIVVNQVLAPQTAEPVKTAYTYQVDILTEAATEPTTTTGVIIGAG